MKKTFTKIAVITLLSILTVSNGVGLFAAFHGHDAQDEHACSCTGCHHDAESDDEQFDPLKSSDDGACQICSLTDGLLKPKDLESVVETQDVTVWVPVMPNLQSLTSPPPLVLTVSPPTSPILFPHLSRLASVIIRC